MRTRVLALIALQFGCAYCFSWDIAVCENKRLKFYNHGILTYTEEIPSAREIFSITYDPVHYRVLFADNHSGSQKISSFDLSTRLIQHLITIKSHYYFGIAYDPVTQLLFWSENNYNIYSFSLNPESSIKAVDGNFLLKLNDVCKHIAVDSCGRYIYWITNHEIARARFDGSETEVLINSSVNHQYSLVIDQQTQKIYWNEKSDGYQESIESADFNGENRITLYSIKNKLSASSLSVSKEFIYWIDNQNAIWQLPKNHTEQLEAKIICNIDYLSSSYSYFHVIAANYTIKEQIKGNQNCEALKSLISNDSERDCIDVKLICFHGTKVSGESRCECTQGYTGERCDISICQNYCLQGNCSVSAEGPPQCRCKAGYSGERCEVNACHKHCLNNGVCSLNAEDDPVCECTADYEGERCGAPICKDYCFKGNCSISAEGQPKCSCPAGYSGDRCEVNACHEYCSNNGVCSLNEEDVPVCECRADYEGERCDISICKRYCLHGNCSVSTEEEPICSCTAGYSGGRCEVNACHKHCLNNGVCSLNEEDEPVCECTADYEGERCDVATTHPGVQTDNTTQRVLRDLRRQVRQVIKEELKRAQKIFSGKIDEYEVNI